MFDLANTTLLCDTSTDLPHPLVPAGWQCRVFDAIHSLSHPGVKASTKLEGPRFVWPGLRKDVRAWAGSCVPSQCAKVHRHTKAPLVPFLVPERRFNHVNVDLVGPLPSSHRYTHLLTMVDRTTRWPEAVPLFSTMAAEVARAFIGCWVARFGMPGDITSDRGPQFTSELWTAVAEHLGVKVHRTIAYNPQGNGLCEWFHRGSSLLTHLDTDEPVQLALPPWQGRPPASALAPSGVQPPVPLDPPLAKRSHFGRAVRPPPR